MSKLNNVKGNIIVFALTAIAIMSLSAAVLFSSSILEMRKSENLKKAVFAAYTAESSAEHSAYLINKALAAGKILDVDIIPKISVMTDCNDAANVIDCAKLQIDLGVSDLPVTLQQNQTITINLYDPEDKNDPPYDPAYEVDKMILEWSEAVPREFEISFILWNVESGIQLLPPVKRRAIGTGSFTFNFNEICTGEQSPGEAKACSEMSEAGDNFILGAVNIGIIRIKLLSSDTLMGGSLKLYKQGSPDALKLIPGFMEIKSTGQEKTNKQALRIVQKIEKAGTGSDFVSEIWDYAIFSNKSLLK
ncbi:MAG: hypothetical protein AAB525_01325 [Patescibacteria group bacterium]